MVIVSCSFGSLIGIPVGLFLYLSHVKVIAVPKPVHQLIEGIINIFRSIPFIILLIFMIPVTRFLVGTSIGTTAAIVPLVVSCSPYIARTTESVLHELDKVLIQVGNSLGASSFQIIRYILIPEALPGLVNGLTITLVNLISYSAMAGTIGGGGLGDLAIRYGYQRFNFTVMFVTIVILVVLVQCIQVFGRRISTRLRH